MQTPADRNARHSRRWMVFGLFFLVYFFVYFHRVSTSVIASDLLGAFDTTATALGFMSSIYFYVYGFSQPVVGYLTDRIGYRRVIAYWTFTAAAGAFIFGMAPNIAWATFGRAMIGFGVGGVYVPTLKALSEWFAPKSFATMVGLMMSVGNLGAVIATTPLAWAAVQWGWRPTFFLIGGITLAMALLILVATDEPPASRQTARAPAHSADGPAASLGGDIIAIFSSLHFWLIVTVFFGVYGTAVTLQGLWATPFLMTALGVERILASKLNMLIPIGVIIGSPLFGWMSERFRADKKWLLVGITAFYTLCWAAILALFDRPSIAIFAVILAGLGIMIGGFISIIWGIIRETTPDERMGLTSGIVNPFPFLGVAVFQVLTGNILDRAGRVGDHYPLAGFKGAFGVCFACALACLALSFFLKSRSSIETHGD